MEKFEGIESLASEGNKVLASEKKKDYEDLTLEELKGKEGTAQPVAERKSTVSKSSMAQDEMVKSWDTMDVLDDLARMRRDKELVTGVVRSVRRMKIPVYLEGKTEVIEGRTLIVALPGGVTGYCPAPLFTDRRIRFLDDVVSHKETFVIMDLNTEHQVAILSGIEADKILSVGFWNDIKEADEANQLAEKTFKGRVVGYNQERKIIYLRVNGQDTYMYRSDWSWQDRVIVDAQMGEIVDVVVVRYDAERKIVRVSRKAATPDPYKILYTLVPEQTVAGRVVTVHPIHGIFVEIETDVELKAFKIPALEEPEVGDLVRCVVRNVEPERRRGRVMIVGYPEGKRTRKDLGSFLFE